MNSLLDQETTPPTEVKNFLTELVGEGKKFKDPEALAKGKYESDQFIEILKRQQDELRADFLKLKEESVAQAKLEDLINQLETRNKGSDDHKEPIVTREEKKPEFDPKELDSLVSNKLKEFRDSERKEANFNSVKAKIAEKLGNDAKGLQERIAATGLTVDQVNELARSAPAAATKLLGLDDQVNPEIFRNPITSTRRNDNFSPKGKEKRTWAYYQELKKTDPKLFYDPQTNVQMVKDSEALGESFRDGDYYAYGQER